MSTPASTDPLRPFPAGQAQSDQEEVLLMIAGKWVAQTLYVLARLGIADLLAEGPRAAADLAGQAGVHERSLYRFLRAAAALGLFAERPDGRFELTSKARYLQSDTPGTMRYLAMMLGMPASWSTYEHTMDVVRTGEPATAAWGGENWFGFMARNPEYAQVFHQAMTSINDSAPLVANSYDFGRFGCIADIGGGQGRLLAAILRRYPATRGILFDIDSAISTATPVLEKQGVAERVRCLAGDFFAAVPGGADAYVMRAILHDWDDERSAAILQNVRVAVAGDSAARLLIIECVIPPLNEWHYGKLMDIDMMVALGGQERTAGEWATLLASAGFELVSITPTIPPHSIIEARPA